MEFKSSPSVFTVRQTGSQKALYNDQQLCSQAVSNCLLTTLKSDLSVPRCPAVRPAEMIGGMDANPTGGR